MRKYRVTIDLDTFEIVVSANNKAEAKTTVAILPFIIAKPFMLLCLPETFFSIFLYLTIIINILINLNILISISPYRDNTIQNSGAKVGVLYVKDITRILISR